eukprot:g1835.t1
MSYLTRDELHDRLSQDDVPHHILEKSHISPAIQPVRRALATKLKADSLKHNLENRPEKHEVKSLFPKGNDKIAHSLQSVAQKLEKEMTKDMLQHQLDFAPSADELVEQGILDNSISASIQGTARKLERKMNQDAVGHQLTTRPAPSVLHDAGVLQAKHIAPRLQGVAATLERKMKSDNVDHMLQSRPQIDHLVERNIVEDDWIAPSIQSRRKTLERAMTADKLKNKLSNWNRPTVQQVYESGLMEAPADWIQEVRAGYQRRHSSVSGYDPMEVPQEYLEDDGNEYDYYDYEDTDDVDDTELYADNQQYWPAVLPNQQTQQGTMLRKRYAIALSGAARLKAMGLIDRATLGVLKELILSNDRRVMAAVEVFEMDIDVDDMLDTLHSDRLSQFVLLSKSAKGKACENLVKSALKRGHIYFYAELFAMANVQALRTVENGKYAGTFDLLRIFTYGKLRDYKDMRNSNNTIPALDSLLLRKLRMLTIVSLCTERTNETRKPTLSYQTLTEELFFSQEELKGHFDTVSKELSQKKIDETKGGTRTTTMMSGGNSSSTIVDSNSAIDNHVTLSKTQEDQTTLHLENLLIQCIYSGLIKGKIDNKNRKFHISSCVGRDRSLSSEQGGQDSNALLIAKLKGLSKRCDSVLESIDQQITQSQKLAAEQKSNGYAKKQVKAQVLEEVEKLNRKSRHYTSKNSSMLLNKKNEAHMHLSNERSLLHSEDSMESMVGHNPMDFGTLSGDYYGGSGIRQ